MTDEQTARRVIWSSRSLRDLESIRAYIGQFAPLNAQRFTPRLVVTVERLAAETVQIVRIKHSAQQLD